MFCSPSFEQLIRMKDHDLIQFESGSMFVQILRVPHGWIYTHIDKANSISSSTFVPILNIKGEE